MNPINQLVVMDKEKLEHCRVLDRTQHGFTCRVMRWVLYGVPPRSAILGKKWEEHQEWFHSCESWEDWRKYYMPYCPTAITFCDLESHATESMFTDEIWERAERRRKEEHALVKAKVAAGEELTEQEQYSYDEVLQEEAFSKRCDEFYQAMKDRGEFDVSVHTPKVLSPWVSPVHSRRVCSWGSFHTPKKSVIGSPPAASVSSKSSISEVIQPIKRAGLPLGLGMHIRPTRDYDEDFGIISAKEACENLGGDISYVVLPPTHDNTPNFSRLMIEAAPEPVFTDEYLTAMNDAEVCHKDCTWLLYQNPDVSEEMVAEHQAVVAYNKNEAAQTLDALKLFGSNLQLLTPMLHVIMKNTALCKAIHQELLARDTGFLNKDPNNPSRFHSRVKSIFATLDRWAAIDIESAIEDVRLILQDHELMLEIIDALDGKDAETDRIIFDSDCKKKACKSCHKDFKELALLYGQESSTLMALGCTRCEETRTKLATQLLWKWFENPDSLSDEQYKKIFSVEKGFQLPEEAVADEHEEDEHLKAWEEAEAWNDGEVWEGGQQEEGAETGDEVQEEKETAEEAQEEAQVVEAGEV